MVMHVSKCEECSSRSSLVYALSDHELVYITFIYHITELSYAVWLFVSGYLMTAWTVFLVWLDGLHLWRHLFIMCMNSMALDQPAHPRIQIRELAEMSGGVFCKKRKVALTY